MSNAPDRYDRFVLPEGTKKVVFEKDTRVNNAGTFRIQREDHTVGNLVKTQLHNDKTVTFSGYKIPHPLEYQMLIKVQTDGSKRPMAAMNHALTDLRNEVQDIREQFLSQREAARLQTQMPY